MEEKVRWVDRKGIDVLNCSSIKFGGKRLSPGR